MIDGASIQLPAVYSRAIPFLLTFTGSQGDTHPIWVVENGVFEFSRLMIRGTVITDLNICDSTPANPFAFVQLNTVGFQPVDMGLGTYRSIVVSGLSRVLLVDPIGTAAPFMVKGMVYGWERDYKGFYR